MPVSRGQSRSQRARGSGRAGRGQQRQQLRARLEHIEPGPNNSRRPAASAAIGNTDNYYDAECDISTERLDDAEFDISNEGLDDELFITDSDSDENEHEAEAEAADNGGIGLDADAPNYQKIVALERAHTSLAQSQEEIDSARQVDADLARQHAKRIYRQAEELRPAKTRNQYNPKIALFRRWYNMKYPNNPRKWITKENAYLFMHEVVFNLRKKSEPHDLIGPKTWDAYRSALAAYHRYQRACKDNPTSDIFPKGGAFSQLNSAFKKRHRELQKTVRGLRGQGDRPLGSAYSFKQLEEIGRKSLDLDQDDGRLLRDRAMFLFNHFLLYRGDSTRNVVLADLAYIAAPNYGTNTQFKILTCISRQSRSGRLDQVGAARNKNVEICPVSALALFLFWRFHVDDEEFPSFNDQSDWYHVKLFRATRGSKKNLTEPLSYQVHSAGAKALLECGNVVTQKVTHSRMSAVQHLTLSGVPEAEIEQHGKWNHSSLNTAYISPLSLPVIRAFSGFRHQNELFYIPRESVTFPDTVKKLIFPQAERIHDELERRFHSNYPQEIQQRLNRTRISSSAAEVVARVARSSQNSDDLSEMTAIDMDEENTGNGTPRARTDLAGIQFLNMLISFRDVILQDAAILMDLHPNRKIWSHSVFQHPDFVSTAQKVLDAHSQDDMSNLPGSERLATVLPEVNAQFQELFSRSETFSHTMRTQVSRTEEKVDRTEEKVDKILQSMETSRSVDVMARLDQMEAQITRLEACVKDIRAVVQSKLDQFGEKIEARASTHSGSSRRTEQLNGGIAVPQGPAFSMRRDINRSVQEAFYEWCYGDENSPAIKTFKNPMQSSWAVESEGNKKWYSRRKLLVEEIEWLVNNNVPLSCALEQTQELVNRQYNGYLHGLQQAIAKEKAKGEHLLENILHQHRTHQC